MKATHNIGRSATARHNILGPLSLRAFARKAGVSPSSLSLILSGKRKPLLSTAMVLSRTSGMSLDEFYRLLMSSSLASRTSRQKKGAR